MALTQTGKDEGEGPHRRRAPRAESEAGCRQSGVETSQDKEQSRARDRAPREAGPRTFSADPQLVLLELEGEPHFSSGLIVHAGQGHCWQALLEAQECVTGWREQKRGGTGKGQGPDTGCEDGSTGTSATLAGCARWLTWAPFTEGITSSGFPLSSTFLCCCNTSRKGSVNETEACIFVTLLPLKKRTKKASIFGVKNFSYLQVMDGSLYARAALPHGRVCDGGRATRDSSREPHMAVKHWKGG